MSNELMTTEKTANAAPPAVLQDRRNIEQLIDQVRLIAQVRQSVMKENVHYGVIPGTGEKAKPTLLKPGAEILLQTFMVSPVIKKEEVIELPREHREYRYILQGLNVHGLVLGEASGSCSTMESKWRFRHAGRSCPNCGKETIIKGQAKYGGGWLCYAKKGGCGAKFKDKDPKIESQVPGRVEHDNPADYYNTCGKMGYKRALSALALIVTGASSDFTQDVEDIEANRKAASPVVDDSAVDVEFDEVPQDPPGNYSRSNGSNGKAPESLVRQVVKNMSQLYPSRTDRITALCQWLHEDNEPAVASTSELTTAQAQKYAAKSFKLSKEQQQQSEVA